MAFRHRVDRLALELEAARDMKLRRAKLLMTARGLRCDQFTSELLPLERGNFIRRVISFNRRHYHSREFEPLDFSEPVEVWTLTPKGLDAIKEHDGTKESPEESTEEDE